MPCQDTARRYNLMFGLNDPWIWGSYFVGLAGVIFCLVYAYIHRNDEDQEDDE